MLGRKEGATAFDGLTFPTRPFYWGNPWFLGPAVAYYRWREAVGPRDKRRPMLNLNWGGVETNQIGTAEFVDFCRRVNTEPLMCVNFEAEGYAPWAKTAAGDVRAGDAREAAEWVDYCNNPGNAERMSHGHREPLPINVCVLAESGPPRLKVPSAEETFRPA